MTIRALRLPFGIDPLIADAKRRARQRRVLVALAVVLVAGGGAGAAFVAATPSAPTTGPRPIQAALVGSEWGQPEQPHGPVGVYAPRFGILLVVVNGSREPVILERVRAVLGAPTGPHVPVGQIGARFRPVGCSKLPCGLDPLLGAVRPIKAERPSPLRLAPGHRALVQLNFRLLACSRRLAQEVVSLQKITALYRLPNGKQISQHPFVVLGWADPVLVRPGSVDKNEVAGPMAKIFTRPCQR